MSTAIVRTATGRVVTFLRPGPLAAGWQPPDGCHAVDSTGLPTNWSYEDLPAPDPVQDELAGVPVTSDGNTLAIPARIVAPADVQVPDPDRGLVLRDADGNDWLLCIASGAVSAVQISSSPEVSLTIRKQRLASVRAEVKALVDANKSKGKAKLSFAERLDAIEAMLGIKYQQ